MVRSSCFSRVAWPLARSRPASPTSRGGRSAARSAGRFASSGGLARDTRLLVVTEGVLTARLQTDPLLSEFTHHHPRRISRAQRPRRSRDRALASGVARARRSPARRHVGDARLAARVLVSRRLPRHRRDWPHVPAGRLLSPRPIGRRCRDRSARRDQRSGALFPAGRAPRSGERSARSARPDRRRRRRRAASRVARRRRAGSRASAVDRGAG